eukprot:629446_1
MSTTTPIHEHIAGMDTTTYTHEPAAGMEITTYKHEHVAVMAATPVGFRLLIMKIRITEWVKLLKRNKCDSLAWSNEIKGSGYVFADAVPHFTSEEVVVFESCEGDRVPVAAAGNGYVV